jgi:serine/threonine protein kinase
VAEKTPCPCCGHLMAPDNPRCPICSCLVTDTRDKAGTLLCNGAFRLLQPLGDGGTTRLYLAESFTRDALCVVKELRPPPEWKTRGLFEAMFEEEARLLHHVSQETSAVPQFYDSFMDSGSFYLVLEFVPGQSLEQYMQAQVGRLAATEVLDYMRQVVDVLTIIHNLAPDPVVHGDIKPSNLIRRPDGRIVVIDFGVAQVNTQMPVYVSGRSSAFGTPGYTPLEQWEGHATPASDIFALGATTHQLLTGRNPAAPFARLAQVSFADLTALTTFPALTTLVPDASPMLELLLAQMLHRRPAERPTAHDLRARITRLDMLLA